MPSFSAIAIFCEDIREDVNGTYSLIGIMGDNIAVPQFPAMMPKLGIHTRFTFHDKIEPTALEIFLKAPNGSRDRLNVIEKDFVARSFKESAEQDNPSTTIYSHLISSPFGVDRAGRYWLELVWNNESLDFGSITFLTQAEAIARDAKLGEVTADV